MDLVTGLLRHADDHLILGHRLSEWCGHAPMLEEDLAMPNIALDLLGQARALYALAGQVEGVGRDEDDFAYRRMERDYTNLLICERPNGDFAHTMLRQFFFAAYGRLFWDTALGSPDDTVRGIAGKAVKEVAYHFKHAAEWVIRLGDGTDESAARMAQALDDLSPYLAEMFEDDLANEGILPNPQTLQADWLRDVNDVFSMAMLPKLTIPDGISGGRKGIHTEDMGFLLADLQYVQRAYPNMEW